MLEQLAEKAGLRGRRVARCAGEVLGVPGRRVQRVEAEVTLLFAAGALSMVAQVVVLRELVAALYGVELLYVLALGSWLAGTAAGSAAGRHVRATAGTGMAGCVALGLLVPAEVVVLRAAGPVSGAVAGRLPAVSGATRVDRGRHLSAGDRVRAAVSRPRPSRPARGELSVGRSYAIESAWRGGGRRGRDAGHGTRRVDTPGGDRGSGPRRGTGDVRPRTPGRRAAGTRSRLR